MRALLTIGLAVGLAAASWGQRTGSPLTGPVTIITSNLTVAGSSVAAGTNMVAVTNGTLVTLSSTAAGTSVAAGTNVVAVTNGSVVTLNATQDLATDIPVLPATNHLADAHFVIVSGSGETAPIRLLSETNLSNPLHVVSNQVQTVVENLTTVSNQVNSLQSNFVIVTADQDLPTAISNLTSGQTLFVMPGIYDITAQCPTSGLHSITADVLAGSVLANVSNVNIVGIAYPTIYSTNYGNFLALANTTNVTVSGLRFESNRPAMPTNAWTEAENDGITCAALLLCKTNLGSVIEDCRFYRMPNQGVSGLYIAKDQVNVTVRRCRFQEVGQTNDIPPWQAGGVPGSIVSGWIDGAPVSGVGPGWIIEENYLEASTRGIELQCGQGGVYGTVISNVIVRKNVIMKNEEKCLWIANGEPYVNVEFTDNYISEFIARRTNSVPQGIVVGGGTNIVIRGNTIHGGYRTLVNGQAQGILVRQPTTNAINIANVVIENNRISDLGSSSIGSPGRAIEVNGEVTRANKIRNVTIRNNKIDRIWYYAYGIVVWNGSSTEVTNGMDVANIFIQGNDISNIQSSGYPEYAPITLLVGSNICVNANRAYDLAYPEASKVTHYGMRIGPNVTNVVIGWNDFSGCKGGITNAAETDNYTFTVTDTNQWYY